MKRTIIAIAALGTFSFASLNTTAQPLIEGSEVVFMQDQRTEIKYEELPEAVSTAFEESQYAQWEVSEVFEVSTDQGKQYELTISDGSQNGTLTFDVDGNIVQ
ncbi:PepSY-like domain-containing protein [Catalinimonas sp. 4WD22]|uniref:PepSY-like domain-containing protein n=1 Tax=Catalinimonas locisalis TaxID=3133978 RepID=UPI003100ADBD